MLPIILCAPKFLDGSMTLGQVMQAASAFTIVQGAFNWLVDNYPRLADWTASARRAASLMVSLDGLERAESGDGVGRITSRPTTAKTRRSACNDLSVTLDDGTAVLDDTDIAIMPGERVLIAGESGTGKSTLVRAIAGLWPWGGGPIEVKKGAKLMLLPQRPYIPIGTLRRAATYPDAADSREVKEVAEAFKRVGLEHLVDRIEDEAPWDQTLSGGEKQRLAFARIFLHNPDIIVLDEATAALDPGEPGQADGAAQQAAGGDRAGQRRPPARARSVPQPQGRAGAPEGRRQACQRHQAREQAAPHALPEAAAHPKEAKAGGLGRVCFRGSTSSLSPE